MMFDDLHEFIPHCLGTKLHVAETAVYVGVKVAQPGRHQNDTEVPGGDAVVMLSDTDLGWANHQFTHDDLFNDIETKVSQDAKSATLLMSNYASVIFGADPEDFKWNRGKWHDSLHPKTFLYGVQTLGVIEHRRYKQHEKRGGGRYLPARYSSGIVEGLWTAADCKAVQRRGRLGLDHLIKEHGKPTPLKELANG